MSEAAERDLLALECMTQEQFRQSMLRLFPLSQSLDQPTLDYIAKIYREIPCE